MKSLEAVRVFAVYFQRFKISLAVGSSVSNGTAVHRALLSLPQPLSQVTIVVCYRSGQLYQLEGGQLEGGYSECSPSFGHRSLSAFE